MPVSLQQVYHVDNLTVDAFLNVLFQQLIQSKVDGIIWILVLEEGTGSRECATSLASHSKQFDAIWASDKTV